jgi:hypothetical protein
MPRFVVLTHDHPVLHWDFMLEMGETLRVWRLSVPPSMLQADATPVPDHRRAYLDYEGPVSGNRGRVTRWDSGEFEWIVDEPNEVSVRLAGGTLRGVARLVPRAEDPERGWSFQFEPLVDEPPVEPLVVEPPVRSSSST